MSYVDTTQDTPAATLHAVTEVHDLHRLTTAESYTGRCTEDGEAWPCPTRQAIVPAL